MAHPVTEGASQPQPLELFRQLPELYGRAAAAGVNLSRFLEDELPSTEFAKDSTRDTFEHVMSAAEIRTKTDIARGIYASKFYDVINHDEKRAIVPEWGRRVWTAAKLGRRVSMRDEEDGGFSRALLGSYDDPLGGVLRPWFDNPVARAKLVQAALPLNSLIALETAIEGDAYRSVFLNEPSAAEIRLARVEEAAEIPKGTLAVSAETMRLLKYGRAIEFPYELARRARMDKVGFFVERMALQAENDKISQVIDTLITGGESPSKAATVFNHSALDAGTTLTVRGYLAYKLKFPNPYRIDTILAQEGAILNLQMLVMPTANPMLTQVAPANGFGSITPINTELSDAVSFGVHADVPTGRYLGFDSRFAIERVSEIGSNISETDRFITRQTQVLTFTEIEGYGVIDANAARILNMA